jgi:chromosome segregation ATPase
MADYQIDPYKLNEVLQQILDKLALLESKTNAATPEFQVLMNNYLTKANEAERNQARFEEALERLEIVSQEAKSYKQETDDLKERIRGYERDFDSIKLEQERDLNNLRDELSKIIQAKNVIEAELTEKHIKELNNFRADADRQISQLQNELNEMVQLKRKFEEKYQHKNQEADVYEKELNELKIKLADEQAQIREEIIEATKRSHQIEQRFQDEKDQLVRRIKELENSYDEIHSTLLLKQRELEYKDALLNQALKQPVKGAPQEPQPNLSVNKTASLVNNQSPRFQEVDEEVGYSTVPQEPKPPSREPYGAKEKKQQVGGIWSKLNQG